MTYQQDKDSATKLINYVNYAKQDDFSQQWRDPVQRQELLNQYDLSSRFYNALLREEVSAWIELIEAISRVMKRLYPGDKNDDYLGEFRGYLVERRVSRSFIDVFERLAYRQIGRKSDLITMHFSEDMSLRDLVHLEDSINKYYYNALASVNNLDRELRPYVRENRLIRVRSFTHPGSVEIFIMAFVIVPVVITLGELLVTYSMAGNQTQRRNQVKLITARFQNTSSNARRQNEESRNEQLDKNESPEEEKKLVLVSENSIPNLSGVHVTVPQEVQEIVSDKTRDPRSYAVAKSGDVVAGRDNS